MTVPFAAIVMPDALVFTEPSGKTHTVLRDTELYAPCLDLLRQYEVLRPQEGAEAAARVEAIVARLVEMVTPARAISQHGEGRITVAHGVVQFDGRSVHNALTDRILWCIAQDLPVRSYIRFLDNLMDNPSRHSVQQVYRFVERHRMGVSEDGHLLAYKRVRDNFTDPFTGTIDNSPGTVVEMARNEVDDDPDRACSPGLHACALSYLPQMRTEGRRVIIVKINPRDVVSIPNDHKDAKLRCCRYEVLDEYRGSDRDDLLASRAVWASDGSEWGADPQIWDDSEADETDEDDADQDNADQDNADQDNEDNADQDNADAAGGHDTKQDDEARAEAAETFKVGDSVVRTVNPGPVSEVASVDGSLIRLVGDNEDHPTWFRVAGHFRHATEADKIRSCNIAAMDRYEIGHYAVRMSDGKISRIIGKSREHGLRLQGGMGYENAIAFRGAGEDEIKRAQQRDAVWHPQTAPAAESETPTPETTPSDITPTDIAPTDIAATDIAPTDNAKTPTPSMLETMRAQWTNALVSCIDEAGMTKRGLAIGHLYIVSRVSESGQLFLRGLPDSGGSFEPSRFRIECKPGLLTQ